MHTVVWPDAPGETMFQLTHGDWIALLRANGFAIERLVEMRAPPGSTAEEDWADPDWGAQWPIEDVWVVRKLADAQPYRRARYPVNESDGRSEHR
jgi:hypothetical protein